MRFRICNFSLVFFLSLSAGSFGQVKYNPAVITKYDSVFNKLDARLQRLVTNPENKMRGVFLLTAYRLDTLNKQDFRPETSSLEKDTSITNYIPEKLLFPDVLVGRAKGSADSLVISISPWFVMGDQIKHKVTGNSVSTLYSLWEKEGRLLKAATLSSNANNLSLNTTGSITLSDNVFSPGKTVYGSAKFITDDFYQLNIPDFKDNTLRLRMAYSYVFKVLTLKDDGL